jgi:hypothetical protein
MGATYAEKNAHFKCKFAFAAMHQNMPMTNRTVVNFARQLRESGRSRSFVPTPKSGAAWGPAGLIAAPHPRGAWLTGPVDHKRLFSRHRELPLPVMTLENR